MGTLGSPWLWTQVQDGPPTCGGLCELPASFPLASLQPLASARGGFCAPRRPAPPACTPSCRGLHAATCKDTFLEGLAVPRMPLSPGRGRG